MINSALSYQFRNFFSKYLSSRLLMLHLHEFRKRIQWANAILSEHHSFCPCSSNKKGDQLTHIHNHCEWRMCCVTRVLALTAFYWLHKYRTYILCSLSCYRSSLWANTAPIAITEHVCTTPGHSYRKHKCNLALKSYEKAPAIAADGLLNIHAYISHLLSDGCSVFIDL